MAPGKRLVRAARRLGRAAPRITGREVLVVLVSLLACAAVVLTASLVIGRHYAAVATVFVAPSSIPPGSVTGVTLPTRYYRSPLHQETVADTSAAWRDIVASETARRLAGASAASVARRVNVKVKLLAPLLVTVKGAASSPGGAARLANAFAEEYIRLDRETFYSEVQRAERTTSRRLEISGQAGETTAQRRRLTRQRDILAVLRAIGPRAMTLVSPARAQASERTPHIARNLGVAAALGLLVGLALVFVPRVLATSHRRAPGPADA